MLVLLVGTGVVLTNPQKAYPWRNLGFALRAVFQKTKGRRGSGDISPFQSLMTSLAATIGTKSLEAGFHLNIAHIPILYLFVFALWIALCVLTFIGWRMRWGEKSEGAE